MTRWLRDRSHGPWLIVYDNVDFGAGLSWMTKEVPTRYSLCEIESLKSCDRLAGRGNLLFTSADFNTLPGGLSRSRLTKASPLIELSSLTKQDAVQLFRDLVGDDNTAQVTETAEKLVAHTNCEPLAIREVTSYMRAMRLTVSQYLEDIDSVREMRSQLVVEDFQDTCGSTAGLNNATGISSTKQISTSISEMLNHSIELTTSTNDVDASLKAVTPADIMTTVSFVARMLLSNPKLSMMFRMIDRTIDYGSQLAVVLQEYPLRLESITEDNLHKRYASFIYQNPKRVAFTLMEQSLQTQEDEKRVTAEELHPLSRSSTREPNRGSTTRFSLPSSAGSFLKLRNVFKYSRTESNLDKLENNDAKILDLKAIRAFF